MSFAEEERDGKAAEIAAQRLPAIREKASDEKKSSERLSKNHKYDKFFDNF